MELGAFSVSLAVADLQAAKAFYEKLGFSRIGGDDTGYLMMANGSATIGLFQGMFEGNILTFNPGLRQDGSQLTESARSLRDMEDHENGAWGSARWPAFSDQFTDVREVRKSLLAQGIELETDTDPEGTGPAHIVIHDPDGNAILLDQFAPKPGTDQTPAD